MNVMIVEDDEQECQEYRETVGKMNNIKIVTVTNSSSTAVAQLQKLSIDAVILDLELTWGEGSGIEFIEKLKKLKMIHMPIIIVVTNICSRAIYDYLHSNFVDYIYFKNQKGFSKKKVFDSLVNVASYAFSKETMDCSTSNAWSDEKIQEIEEIIESEFNALGILPNKKGYNYLKDAIVYLIKNTESSEVKIVDLLSITYNKKGSSILRAMQTAIESAWKTTSPIELERLYTAAIDPEKGVPSTMPFIYYYKRKILKSIS